MGDNSLKKGRYTKYPNKIGLYSNDRGNYIKNDSGVVLNFPFKDAILEAGMSKEDVGREERFLNVEVDSKDIDTLEEPKVLTDFRYIDKDGEKSLTASGDFSFFDKEGNLTQNLLIKGNNLLALYTLREKLAGKVKLIYIDPPYNTDNDGFKYNDSFNRSAWLAFMKNRLEVARELLSEDGAIYVNLDFHEVHYAKVLMDELYGKDNFQREIIWRIGWLSGYKTADNNYIRNHDSILFYSKNNSLLDFKKHYIHNENFKDIVKFEKIKDIGLKFGLSKDQQTELYEFINHSSRPERYPIEDVWNGNEYDDLNSIAIVSFAGETVSKLLEDKKKEIKGQKSEKLVQRIIAAHTEKGDLVLDYHLGSGTTSAVAHKMGRRWIGIEQMDYIDDIAMERLKQVVNGEQFGISKSVNWKGGGSFVYFELKKYNQEYIDRIKEATSLSELEELYVDMRNNAFLKFWFDRAEFEKDENFRKLDIEQRKQKLIDVLDENQLYLNYADMNDTRHNVGDDEKILTERFYGAKQN
jgi:adenine-specific DNA-methyltransferase